ncbi:MAG: hypothetical protein EB060_09710 [Proteobacteria bacterium]|nr:hypothetical protein [Pseudomonadota bacterium]
MHYRTLSEAEKIEILGQFGLIYLRRAFEDEVIPEGRSDTKFRFMVDNHSKKEEVVLTIYETPDVHINGREPFYAEASTRYAAHVAQKLIDMKDRDGNPVRAALASPYQTMDTAMPFIHRLFGGVEKVVTITPFIERARDTMDASDTREAGRALAAMHRAAEDFTEITLPNNFGPAQLRGAFAAFTHERETMVQKLSVHLGMSNDQASLFMDRTATLLDKILTAWDAIAPKLATGWINGDYFPDNTLPSRDGKFITFDLGMICQDTLIYDVAIGMNAWSFSGAECDRAQAAMFLAGYNNVKEITPPELDALPLAAAVAGIRWTMSRMGKLMDDLPTRSPVDSLNQARFWEIFIDQGQRIELSGTATISDRVSQIGLKPQ